MSEISLDVSLPDGYIATFTGRSINPMQPDMDAISIVDIAHALSNQCRFTGHVRQFYSVAEHSVRCLLWVADYIKKYENDFDSHTELMTLKWTLLHDASEAYLSDIARPVKSGLGLGEVYKNAETNLMLCIAQKYGLSWPMPELVKRADDVLLRTEQRDLMPLGRIPGNEYLDEPILDTWDPPTARDKFLYYVDELAIE